MSGKGSTPRPLGVDRATFAAHYDRIFGSAARSVMQTRAIVQGEMRRDRVTEYDTIACAMRDAARSLRDEVA